MICPKCQRAYYFLKSSASTTLAVCQKCHFCGEPQKISYDSYHANFYSKPYRRNLKTDPQMDWILKALAIQPDDVVIDLGCGVGDYAKAIYSFSEKVAGYDRDVQAAKKKYPRINFFPHNLDMPIPLPDASVDKIVAINVIEHLRDWDFFLRECLRVLRPGGTIALSTANREFILHRWHFDVTHYIEWNLSEFTKLAELYFRVVHARKDCAMFNYYPLNLLLRHVLKPDLTIIAKKHN